MESFRKKGFQAKSYYSTLREREREGGGGGALRRISFGEFMSCLEWFSFLGVCYWIGS